MRRWQCSRQSSEVQPLGLLLSDVRRHAGGRGGVQAEDGARHDTLQVRRPRAFSFSRLLRSSSICADRTHQGVRRNCMQRTRPLLGRMVGGRRQATMRASKSRTRARLLSLRASCYNEGPGRGRGSVADPPDTVRKPRGRGSRAEAAAATRQYSRLSSCRASLPRRAGRPPLP